MIIEEGDWVSFILSGKLQIAEVRYILKKPYGLMGFDLYTDIGVIDYDTVLEVRRDGQKKSN